LQHARFLPFFFDILGLDVCVEQNDPHCTLKEVFYVVNGQNVWGNVQQVSLQYWRLRCNTGAFAAIRAACHYCLALLLLE
jgi:hypothetical protein